ncbi:hypothetical protein SAMN06295885_2135 [Rathayibacter oskolensis]|uniref:Uncharacterized protein n=1 Tax=Rathayibacter oskolensis TaxID=1891671 RepID=A0A1X7NXN0_9MICO|nr:hypothetical protein [Rathayibacter oskolensis]SMH43041.1 hypothetical protein SAMN06295885_2135 [Rathayibacter oskolensis]
MTSTTAPASDAVRADRPVDLLGTSSLLTTIELGDSVDFYLATVARGAGNR